MNAPHELEQVCPSCGYDLGETPANAACPECGVFTPTVRRTPEELAEGFQTLRIAWFSWQVTVLVVAIVHGYSVGVLRQNIGATDITRGVIEGIVVFALLQVASVCATLLVLRPSLARPMLFARSATQRRFRSVFLTRLPLIGLVPGMIIGPIGIVMMALVWARRRSHLPSGYAFRAVVVVMMLFASLALGATFLVTFFFGVAPFIVCGVCSSVAIAGWAMYAR